MGGNKTAPYLDGLPPERAAELARVNKPGLTALRDYLASGQAVAFLGAGVSAPLYPLWTGLIDDLVDAAAARLDDRKAQTCRALASQSPEEVVEIVRTALGAAAYREALRRVLRVRTDPETGRSWTPVQELVLTELVPTLTDLAEYARVSGDLDGAERHATEAIAIAAPRSLVPAHCAALAARARIAATRATADDPDPLYSGRDAADAAIRLAARHQLPWCELDALRAHALLDQAEGIDRGWGAKADALHARLVAPGLDPDPLGTVERLVAAEESED